MEFPNATTHPGRLQDRLARLLDSTSDLPTLPEVVLRLQQLVRREDAAPAAISAEIRRDPVLAARVLRAANAAALARAGVAVQTVDAAVTRLGLRRVGTLCLAAETIRLFQDGRQLDHQAFWRHSFTVASVATAIAERLGIPHAEELYLAGLLHDLGILILDQHLPEAYAVVQEAVSTGRPRAEVERRALGMDHGGIGARWLAHWSLPEAQITAVADHHRTTEALGLVSTGGVVLAAAEALVGEYGAGLDEEGPPEGDADLLLAALGLEPGPTEELRLGLAGIIMEATGLVSAVVPPE